MMIIYAPAFGRLAPSRLASLAAAAAVSATASSLGAKRPRCEAVAASPLLWIAPLPAAAVVARTAAISQQLRVAARELQRRVALGVRCLLRLLKHALVLGPAACAAPLALALATRDPTSGELVVPEWWWRMFCSAMERSGPCLLKFAQWGAARRDLFPAAFCRHAGRLQDRTSAHGGSWHHARQALNAALGPARVLRYRPSSSSRAPLAVGWRWPATTAAESASSAPRRKSRLPHQGDVGGVLTWWELELEGPDGAPPPALGAGCVASVYRGRARRAWEPTEAAATASAARGGGAPACPLDVFDYGGSEEVAVKVSGGTSGAQGNLVVPSIRCVWTSQQII
jgi:predicted unusual protein kinase regulating ubiquinone biosynthesis (AarF/ABC1/UbiB family)